MDELQTQNVKRGRMESEKENRSLYICMVQYVGDHPLYIVHAINFVDFIHDQPPTVDGDELVTNKVCDFCSSGSGELPLLRNLASIHDDNLCYSPGCGVFGSQITFADGLEPDRIRSGPLLTAMSDRILPLGLIITKEFIDEKTQPFMVDFKGDDGKNNLYAPSGSPFSLCFPPTF
ncbi:hypothetical protein DVH24_014743 [Malus domestica]|uniref:Uncharacterized protein n=1 Tax=Malus domestica TaxID=3750 RepID=A0A498K554_MALDO|nr:hypothetical protein DVH24_014743 [Malus domestica]